MTVKWAFKASARTPAWLPAQSHTGPYPSHQGAQAPRDALGNVAVDIDPIARVDGTDTAVTVADPENQFPDRCVIEQCATLAGPLEPY